MKEKCEIKGCREERALGYYGSGVCFPHWIKHCQGKINLKTTFRIKEEK